MALTKVNRGGLNTGISDSSDANAITIDSSENVLIGDASPQVTSKLTVSGNGSADTATFMYDGTAGTYLDINTNTANGIISLEANARSGNYPPLTFITSGSERLRIQAGGGISFNGDTAAANALDDYETGSATLTYTGDSNPTVVYEHQAAEYVKVGDFVIVCGRLRTSSVSSQGSGGLRLSGLPFTVDTGQIWGSVNIGYGTGWPTGNTPATGYAEPGTTRCDLIKADSDARNGLDTSVSAGSLRTDAGNDIIFTITYKTA